MREVLTSFYKKQFVFFLFFLSPVAALFSPQSMPLIVIILAFVGGIDYCSQKHSIFKNFSLSTAHIHRFFLIFMGYGLLSFLWSQSPLLTLETSGKLGILWTISLFISHFLQKSQDDYDGFLKALFWGHIAACLFILMNHFFGNPLAMWKHVSGAKALVQGGLFLSLSFWVIFSYLLTNMPLTKGRLFLRISFTALTALTLACVHCDTAFYSLFFGCIIAFLFWKAHLPGLKRIVQSLIILAFLTTPMICFYAFSPQHFQVYNEKMRDISYLHRLFIWHETSKKIAARPLLGHGLSSYKTVADKGFVDIAYTNKKGEKALAHVEKMGIHPHNIALQLWFELGFLGAALGGALTAFLFGVVYDIRNSAIRFCGFGFFSSAMLTFWVNLGVFQTWWIASLIILIHLLTLARKR